MPQISRRKLDKDIETEMFRQFWASFLSFNDVYRASSFFSDLLTDTERIMLAKRFTIAVLLLRGKRPIEIKETLHVTFSTIGSVGSWLKNAKPETASVLKAIIRDGKWQALLDRVDALLDELPPAYGTNWSLAGKAKWKRKMERASRRVLR